MLRAFSYLLVHHDYLNFQPRLGMHHFISVVLFTFALGGIASGQNNGTIQGLVTDPTGAVIVDSAVAVEMNSARMVRNTVTDEQGRYQVTGLPLGPFSLRVTAKGFQPAESSGELR